MSRFAFGGPSVNELLSNVSIPASVCLPLINPEAVQSAFSTLFETVKEQDAQLAISKQQIAATLQHNTQMACRIGQLEKSILELASATRVNQRVLGIPTDSEAVLDSNGLPWAPPARVVAQSKVASGDVWGAANASDQKRQQVVSRWGRLRALARIRKTTGVQDAQLCQEERTAFSDRMLKLVEKEISGFSAMDSAVRDRKIADTKTVCMSEAAAATTALTEATTKDKLAIEQSVNQLGGQLGRAESAIQTLQMQVEITSAGVERAQAAGAAAGEAADAAAREAAVAAAKGAADLKAMDAASARAAAAAEAARLKAQEEAALIPPVQEGPTTAQIMEHVEVRVMEIVNEHMGDKFAADKLAQKATQALKEVQQVGGVVRNMEIELRQCATQGAELKEGKLDIGEVKELEQRFKDAQERQRDKFARETASLLKKMEASVTGLDCAAQEMNKLLVNKADQAQVRQLEMEIREMMNAAAATKDDDSDTLGALSVHKCLSCNQSLNGTSTNNNSVLNNRFPAAAPPSILPSRPQSAVSPIDHAAVTPWEDSDGFRVTIQAPEARHVATVDRHHTPPNMRPHSSAVQRRASPRDGFGKQQDSRNSGPSGYGYNKQRPLTALDHRTGHSRAHQAGGDRAQLRPPTAHLRLPGQGGGAMGGLSAEGVVSSTAPFAKRQSSLQVRRPVSAMNQHSVVNSIHENRPVSAMQ